MNELETKSQMINRIAELSETVERLIQDVEGYKTTIRAYKIAIRFYSAEMNRIKRIAQSHDYFNSNLQKATKIIDEIIIELNNFEIKDDYEVEE